MRTPAEIVDAAAPARVLVFGSLPGSGRDLDLLVRDADLPPIEQALAREGFRNRGDEWVRFRDCTADAVVCAWVGVCVAEGRAEALGDAESAIWVPIHSA